MRLLTIEHAKDRGSFSRNWNNNYHYCDKCAYKLDDLDFYEVETSIMMLHDPYHRRMQEFNPKKYFDRLEKYQVKVFVDYRT